ncbi:MAG: glycosyltransferase family 9 protein [Pseudomonadota bacterium]
MPRTDVRKILILRFSSLGDIIMATAMIRCLRKQFPLAQIDMVVRSDFYQLIEQNPHLDRKLTVDRRQGWKALWQLKRDINRQHYDVIYDAHRSLRSILLMPWLFAETKIYFKKPYLKRALAMTFKWKSLIRGSKRMLERYVEPLEAIGVSYDGLGPELFVPEPSSEENSKWIGVIPSAQWPGKRWSHHHFRSTLEILLKTTKEKFLVFGGPEDSFCADLVRGLPEDRVRNLQGKLSLTEVFHTFKSVKCCIANDTGLMHVADAMNIPSVLIFGPTNTDMGCLPFHPQTIIVEHDLWCRPCSKNGQAPCIRSKRWCLELTTPSLVADKTHQLLNSLSKESQK